MTGPTASLMNGWDYVLTITEEQINKGLRIAYEGGYVGTALPRMPKGQHTLPLDGEGTKQLVVTFGCPRMHATHEALKQCELVIPLPDSSVVEGGKSTPLPPDTCLIITTSLSSTATSVEEGATAGAASHGPEMHHVAFVDF